MIYIESLSKVYDGEVKALTDLNLNIPSGEIFGLLGPNGAGKTTTIRLLSCILKPTKGDAVVADLSINHDQEKIRSLVGLLSETPSLYERLSTRRNLEIIGRLYGLSRQQARNKTIELAKVFAFEENLNKEAGKLSKGNKHKVAIARSLIHEPKVLFLDEPTASLDPEMAKIVRDTIDTLTDNYEVTVIICTHNLPEAERLCDRVGIINKGRIIATGTVGELIKAKDPDTEYVVKLKNLSTKYSSVIESNSSVHKIVSNEQEVSYSFKLENPEDNIPNIVKDIVNSGGELLALYQKKKSLEDVYFEYIKQEEA